ncbi:hypothetical protein GCM10023238_01110 [Streptomyces heliomycini]
MRAAPERAALLARLRTMGLTRAQGRRLLVLESLPQALLAALGGVLTAWATVRLLAPGIDLTAAPCPPPRRRRGGRCCAPIRCRCCTGSGGRGADRRVAVTQAWWTGRAGRCGS